MTATHEAATPAMRQYLAVKAEHPEAIVLFRIGDFFEAFYEDAEACSRLLDLTLTSRSKDKDAAPMAGVPAHAVDSYLARLVELGKKVVLVDQVEDSRKAKGLVRREITRILTPGTFLDPNAPPRQPSDLLAVAFGKKTAWGLAALDLSTGEYRATFGDDVELLVDEVARAGARELLVLEPAKEDPRVLRIARDVAKLSITARKSATKGKLAALLGSEEVAAVARILPAESLDAAELALAYAEETQLPPGSLEKQAGGTLGHVQALRPYMAGDALLLDTEARAHLELFRAAGEGGRRGSLLGAIDEAVTAMGGRLLARWLARPLVSPEAIGLRQEAVEALVARPTVLDRLREGLAKLADVERLLGRVVLGRASPRDLGAMRGSLEAAPAIFAAVRGLSDGSLFPDAAPVSRRLEALSSVDIAADVRAWLAEALVDNPTTEMGDTPVFREGFDAELDRLWSLAKSGKDVLAELERRERERTGINSLKVRFNRVFGYYIEITRANLKAVPKDYVRKQTTANGERYYTDELKGWEEQILTADEKRVEREKELFLALALKVGREARRLRALADALAELDVLAGFARLAERRGWVRPEVDDGDTIDVSDGRHPVLEALAEELGERFVPNDLTVGGERRLLIITGPNMAGKSTIMRQTALIVILAQMGAFVPAKRARVGVVDRVFTRVGASDDLSRGRSTFMVEMTETARILRSATPRSLILLDEIGRGTSTFDGLSIAWAVAEHLHDAVGAKTLFATHYHELTELAHEKPRVRNQHVAVKEWNEEIVFLRKLAEGPTNKSYGVQVARLAGLPRPVIERARAILSGLESQSLGANDARRGPTPQLDLFGAKAEHPILEALRGLALDDLTPRRALALLAEWQEELSRR